MLNEVCHMTKKLCPIFRFPTIPICNSQNFMEQWWNDTDRENLKYWEKKLSQFYLVHHKIHMERPAIETRSPQRETGD